jgi:protein-S-isoprenylcysteine O-methyltransferase Ste14
MTKSGNPLVKMVKAAIVGAAIGALIVRWFRPTPATATHLQFSMGMKISAGLWLLFSIYWSIAAKDSLPTKTAESGWSRQLHLILVNGALLLLILPVPGLTRQFVPDNRVVMVAGLVVQTAFILLAAWGRIHLGSNWSGEVRIAKEHQLVRSDPYRYVRHPIYTAVLGMYCGTALVSGQVHAPLALVLVTLAYWRKIRLEERALGETFGREFQDYQRGTWALVPLVY